MKIKIIYLLGILLIAFAFLNYNNAISFTDGAPSGCSGSPKDGSNCSTNCHNTALKKAEQGWIKTNIPEKGYIADSSYIITVTATGSEVSAKFGFEFSPQFITGKVAGKIIITNANETKLVGGGKYITQKAAGVVGKVSKEWTFKWIAPVKGSGKITFYSAFIVGGKPENSITSSLEINESI
ncbi:MAG: hypothetical protein HGB12_00565 [Bacteroidetes bacterium]|nr:hypothetical protein [Bacteroidota bacterium]